MNTAKDLIMKKEMMKSFEQSNKTLESISKMTECLTSIGDGIASEMCMLAMVFSNPPPTMGVPHAPQVYYPHFNTYIITQMKRKTFVVLEFTKKDFILEYIVRSNYSWLNIYLFKCTFGYLSTIYPFKIK